MKSRLVTVILFLFAFGAGLHADTMAFSTTSNGSWTNESLWTIDGSPAGRIPAAGDDVVIPGSRQVLLADTAAVASLTVATNAVLSIGGANALLHWRAPADTNRTEPVGISVSGSALLSGTLVIGGLNQRCPSFLTVGGDLVLSNANNNALVPSALVVYAGPTNDAVAYSNGGARVSVGGTLLLATNTSLVMPYASQRTGASVVFEAQRVVVAAPQAQFFAVGRGYALVVEPTNSVYYGPGTALTGNSQGGTHGGKGGNNVRPEYGFRFAPFMAGSPGRTSTTNWGLGGGVIRIHAAEDIVLNGRLIAEGSNYNGNANGAGSGGSVWLTCAGFSAGSGALISVKGGGATQHSSCGAGGGGRIAIMTDSPTAAQFGSLFATGTCDNLLVVTTNMADPVLSPYPALCNVAGGICNDQWYNPTYAAHGKPGSAVFLRNKGADHGFSVRGNVTPMPATPAYGVTKQPAGSLYASAVSPSAIPGSGDRSRLTCTGYAWSNAVDSASGSGTGVTIAVSGDTWLNWTWENPEHRLDVRSGGKGGVQANYDTWYTNGAAITLTPVPDAGCTFLYWAGDVPHGNRFDNPLTLTMDRPRSVIACFSAPVEEARTLTWVKPGTNDWFDPANWDGTAIPGLHDTVLITNGTSLVGLPADVTVASLTVARRGCLLVGGLGGVATACTPLDLNDNRPYMLIVTGNMLLTNYAQVALGGQNATGRVELAVGGDLVIAGTNTLAVYAGFGENTNDFANGGAKVTVAGSTWISGPSWVVPTCHQRTGLPVVFALQDLTVATNGGFNADYRGFGRALKLTPAWAYDYYGPGRGTAGLGQWGGTYGGRGGGSNNVIGCGFAYAAFQPGSPGKDPNYDMVFLGGGGAVRIDARNVTLNGQILARGYGRYPCGGGSGGGIFITAQTMTMGPASKLNAEGGPANFYSDCGGGGGGRIAVGLNLTPDRIASLYATGNAKGVTAVPMASAPGFGTGAYNVNGGLCQQNMLPAHKVAAYNGQPGTAYVLTGRKPGAVVLVR